jgi:RNA polymerase sigma-70 factor (ECF subfamily)
MLYEIDPAQVGSLSVTVNELTDEELMARLCKEDETALSQLYQRHVALLRTIISRVVNNDADVDDLLQEVFLEIWRQASRYDEKKGKALGWIVTLARRRAIDRVRRRQAYQRAQDRLLEETKVSHEPIMQHGADEDLIAADRGEILQKVFAKLPEAQWKALHLAFYRGMSQREIAAHTGIPLGTIKTRLELAMRKVRAALLSLGGVGEWGTNAA